MKQFSIIGFVWKLLLSIIAVLFSMLFVTTLLFIYIITIPVMLWYLVSDAAKNIWSE